MTIAVINLARSRDRRELIESTFARLGLGFEFFAGIDAWRGEHVRFFQYYETAVPERLFSTIVSRRDRLLRQPLPPMATMYGIARTPRDHGR